MAASRSLFPFEVNYGKRVSALCLFCCLAKKCSQNAVVPRGMLVNKSYAAKSERASQHTDWGLLVSCFTLILCNLLKRGHALHAFWRLNLWIEVNCRLAAMYSSPMLHSKPYTDVPHLAIHTLTYHTRTERFAASKLDAFMRSILGNMRHQQTSCIFKDQTLIQKSEALYLCLIGHWPVQAV
jgi:hypothetical protein